MWMFMSQELRMLIISQDKNIVYERRTDYIVFAAIRK